MGKTFRGFIKYYGVPVALVTVIAGGTAGAAFAVAYAGVAGNVAGTAVGAVPAAVDGFDAGQVEADAALDRRIARGETDQ